MWAQKFLGHKTQTWDFQISFRQLKIVTFRSTELWDSFHSLLKSQLDSRWIRKKIEMAKSKKIEILRLFCPKFETLKPNEWLKKMRQQNFATTQFLVRPFATPAYTALVYSSSLINQGGSQKKIMTEAISMVKFSS